MRHQFRDRLLQLLDFISLFDRYTMFHHGPKPVEISIGLLGQGLCFLGAVAIPQAFFSGGQLQQGHCRFQFDSEEIHTCPIQVVPSRKWTVPGAQTYQLSWVLMGKATVNRVPWLRSTCNVPCNCSTSSRTNCKPIDVA